MMQYEVLLVPLTRAAPEQLMYGLTCSFKLLHSIHLSEQKGCMSIACYISFLFHAS